MDIFFPIVKLRRFFFWYELIRCGDSLRLLTIMDFERGVFLWCWNFHRRVVKNIRIGIVFCIVHLQGFWKRKTMKLSLRDESPRRRMKILWWEQFGSRIWVSILLFHRNLIQELWAVLWNALIKKNFRISKFISLLIIIASRVENKIFENFSSSEIKIQLLKNPCLDFWARVNPFNYFSNSFRSSNFLKWIWYFVSRSETVP